MINSKCQAHVGQAAGAGKHLSGWPRIMSALHWGRHKVVFHAALVGSELDSKWESATHFKVIIIIEKPVRAVALADTLSFKFQSVVYTGWSQKKDTQFYLWDNFGNSAPILAILSLLPVLRDHCSFHSVCFAR